jgi:hypothetical protein
MRLRVGTTKSSFMSLRTNVVALLGVLLSGATGTITFERTWYPGYLQVVEQTPDDGYILAFQSHDSALEQVGGLVKTDSLGNFEWWRQYHSPNHNGGSFRGVCATLDGGYVGAGDIGAPTVSDAWAVKTDSVGDSLWAYVHVGPGLDYFLSAAPAPDSGCVLVGKLSQGNECGLALLKLSRNGEREWFRVFRPPGTLTWGGTVRETNDSGFIANGVIEDDSSDIDDDYIVRTDSVGETLWTVRYRPEIPGYPGGWHGAGCVTADGGYAICGMAAMPDAHRSYVARFDSTGVNLWFRVLFDNGVLQDHMLKCVQATPDRGLVVVGSQLGGSPKGIVLVRLDSLGDTLWTRLFDAVYPELEDWGYWVINTHDGGFAACGTADQDRYAYLIKTDSLGLVYTAVSEHGPGQLRDDLLTAEPNPFRRIVNIRCGPGLAGTLSLNIFDAAGRVVRRLPSARDATWDGRDESGRLLPAGAYFIEARAGSERRVAQVLLAR